MAEMHGKNGRTVEQLTKELGEDAELRKRLAADPGAVLGEYGLADLVAQRGVQIKFDIGTGEVGHQAGGPTTLAIFGIHIDFTGEHIDNRSHWDLSKPHNDAAVHADLPSFHADSSHTDVRPHIDL